MARAIARSRRRRLHRPPVYPQVEVGAGALADVPLVTVPVSMSVAEALGVARRREAPVLVAGDAFVLRDDLSRAATLGVGEARAQRLARPLPVVEANASEVAVRRHLAAGAPLVIVRDGKRLLGAVSGRTGAEVTISLADRLGRRLAPACRDVLQMVAGVASERGARAYLAAGVVRDALLAGPLASPDLDVVVEGDGPGVARALAAALGAPVVEHERFLTATVGPTAAGRIDVATARSERYDTRGALPRVMPSSIEQDLRRRDFTVNAMAVELASGTLGLLDRHGGREDLAARRLRVLHPASFVEDPTRIFRAARFCARLGFHLDPWTARCQAWALSLVPYPALSGPRLLAELEHVLREARPDLALVRLGVAGAYRLLEPRYRFGRAARVALQALPGTLAWARTHRVDVAGIELLLTALLAGQDGDVARAALRRLQISGDRAARLERVLDDRGTLGRALASASRASDRARLMRARSPLELGWLALGGDEATRAHVEWFAATGAARGGLRGDDVIALGVAAGPAVAAVLEALRDARLDGEVTGRTEEAAFVRAWAAEHAARKEW
jgi:tRNA nucleotidyltransferase (CCA-adding enzyme)